ncbi:MULTISPECIES: STAS domain-containing protein [Flavobacteriaceae]|uniref:STAS domain-containing protein n=1 Tax=Flavobacteriaceae TaxID=49546 RepID=UPI0014922724|nr:MULTISPECIES: STAS domain-containing protein [Allomuricauda]MDC6366957.1 STAS domain-containing protein [Muricauda sp. AC10]
MALQITEVRGTFSIHGTLNSGNVNILKRHLARFLNPKKPVVLNLERVQQLDRSAAHALKNLYAEAVRSNCVLSIIGRQNMNLFSVMEETNTSFILSSDRI